MSAGVSSRAGLLAGRVAVVTGGASGLGAAIVRCFAREGAVGTVLDVAPVADEALPSAWRALAVEVRDPESVAGAFAEVVGTVGRPDVVVANAGIVPPWSDSAHVDVDEWERVFAVNVRGVMLTIREALRVIGEHGASIVAMCSLNGWKGDPHIPAYVASKHAVLGLVRSVALDVGRTNVRVNAVAPGPVATAALVARVADRAARTGLDVPAALAQAAEQTALGRIATAEEVAHAVLFLASDLSSGITGHLLPVDGGMG